MTDERTGNALSINIDLESLNIGETEINGLNLSFFTDDTETANKIMYLTELATAIISTKVRKSKHEI